MTETISIAEWRKMKQSKYKNRRTEVNGIIFASKKEAARYKELWMLEAVNAIQNLKCQVRFPIIVNGQKICVYVSDFVYEKNGKRIIEDTKGYRTDVYKLKTKLIKATLGIDILET